MEVTDVKPLIPESSTSESSRVDSVLQDYRDGTIQIPDYQRDSDQWDDTTKSLLVESVINNLSIPAFFFEVAVDLGGIERNQVIDGQQRLTTLAAFYSNKFRLVGSNDAAYITPNSVHYAGKTFDELPNVYKQSFAKYRLAIIKLRDLKDMRLEEFRRINQGGTPLSGQDIRLAYYGDRSPSVTFLRLAGIYDANREAARRFIETARTKYGIDHPWQQPLSLQAWQDLWHDKELARGQTASEMFLWSVMAAKYSELDSLLQNQDALRKINVSYNREIDGAMDVACAQLQYQDAHPGSPRLLFGREEIEQVYFPHFEQWIGRLGTMGPSLDVRKYRTIASLIGAAFKQGIRSADLSKDKWGMIVEFVRRPTEKAAELQVEWPQSKGRWDGAKGYRAQLERAGDVIQRIMA